MAQDDSREKEQIKIFGLEEYSASNRGASYTPDAKLTVDGTTYEIELKTGNVSRKTFSTARGFDENKIKEWKHNDVFIFSLYEKDQTSLGFRFCDHLMATPENLSFFFDHVIKTTMTEGHAGKLGSSQYNALIRPHLAETVCPDVLKKFDKTVKVGCQYNDPKVSWKKLLMSGAVLVDKQRPQEHLKEYLINLVDKT